jgi:hypothetical protein
MLKSKIIVYHITKILIVLTVAFIVSSYFSDLLKLSPSSHIFIFNQHYQIQSAVNLSQLQSPSDDSEQFCKPFHYYDSCEGKMMTNGVMLISSFMKVCPLVKILVMRHTDIHRQYDERNQFILVTY